ncbi:MAG TPA: class I SAM-dependent methyltransferase, partial [Polyangiaceae bacterium]|nr:class I SAM-dependent methyltransferase [Polyangiaceae bacterium]
SARECIMKESQSSSTARLVSLARGVGVSSHLRDPLAHAFSGGKLGGRLLQFEREAPAVRAARYALRALSLGLVDHNTVRMVLVDRYLERWLQAGIRQVVLLGAGLDSRAWRLDALASAVLYEVDHPDTQAFKRAQAAPLRPRAERVVFVPADFERNDVGAALAEHGHDASAPTAWVCEGVTAYLTPATTGALLRAVRARSAARSQLALSYVTPPRSDGGAASKLLIQLILKRMGERARGLIAPEAVAAELAAAGFERLEDLGWTEWIARIPEYSALPNLLKERLVIAGT